MLSLAQDSSGVASGSSVCEQGQGRERGIGPGFVYFSQL